jgi:glycosyltransferase involved in cell wall biosynthesis
VTDVTDTGLVSKRRAPRRGDPQRMRILIDIIGATHGGGLTRSRELARTFPVLAPEHEYLYVATGAAREAVRKIANADVITPPAAASRPPLRLAWEHWRLPHTAGRAFRPDVVFTPFNVAPVSWPDPQPRLFVLVSNLNPFAPEVTRLYSGRDRLRLELLRRLTNRSIERAERVYLLSAQSYDLMPALDASRAEVIPMAPPPPPPEGPPPDSAPSEPYFVIAGDVYRYKGVEMAIEALGVLAPRDRPVILVAGSTDADPGYAARLRDRATALGLGDRVRFLGSRGHEEILGLIQSAAAVLAPSRFETLSRVPIEAMALGTPVLATDVPTYREACGDAALYFALDDTEGLATLLTRVVSDDELVERHRQLGATQQAGTTHGDASMRILAGMGALPAVAGRA